MEKDLQESVIIKNLFSKDVNSNTVMSHFSVDLLNFMKDLATISKRGDLMVFNGEDIPPLYVLLEEDTMTRLQEERILYIQRGGYYFP